MVHSVGRLYAAVLDCPAVLGWSAVLSCARSCEVPSLFRLAQSTRLFFFATDEVVWKLLIGFRWEAQGETR